MQFTFCAFAYEFAYPIYIRFLFHINQCSYLRGRCSFAVFIIPIILTVTPKDKPTSEGEITPGVLPNIFPFLVCSATATKPVSIAPPIVMLTP